MLLGCFFSAIFSSQKMWEFPRFFLYQKQRNLVPRASRLPPYLWRLSGSIDVILSNIANVFQIWSTKAGNEQTEKYFVWIIMNKIISCILLITWFRGILITLRHCSEVLTKHKGRGEYLMVFSLYGIFALGKQHAKNFLVFMFSSQKCKYFACDLILRIMNKFFDTWGSN